MVLAVYMPPQAPTVGQAGAVGADRLEGAGDGEVLPLPAARLDGAAVDVDRRNVHARDRHHAAGHVLVAGADDQHAVHHLSVGGGLDGVGDDLTRHERVLHAFGPHADTVGDGGDAKRLRHRTLGAQHGHGPIHQRLDASVAGVHVGVAVGDADDGFLEVLVAESDRTQHRAIGRTRDAVGDESGTPVVGHGDPPGNPGLG
jgi:hypothetical protein